MMGKPVDLRFSILADNRKHPNIVNASMVVKEWPFMSHPFMSAFWESVLIVGQ
jgi:hypothetical protein